MARNIGTKIIQAEHASDLSEDTQAVQVLRAVGLAAARHDLGFHLTRALHSGRARDKLEAALKLSATIHRHYARLSERDIQEAAVYATVYWYDPSCALCHGRGYEVIPDTPTLSDRPCVACHGAGRRPFEPPEKIKKAAEAASKEIDRATEAYGIAAGVKLGR